MTRPTPHTASRPRLSPISCILAVLVVAGSASRGDVAQQQSALTAPWVMHKIDNAMWNHNSLSPGDVNGDGYMDYAVIHEGPDKYTFILHPGKHGDVKAPWEKVVVGHSVNPEYSDFGDFDGDGQLDIVGVGGEGAGAKIFWGPESSRVTDPHAWQDSGVIEGTRNRGHFLYVRTRDINRDGAPDIVIGGRVQGTHNLKNMKGKRTAGIIWIEAPADRNDRRDPAKWIIHDIDSKSLSGHSFEFCDVDGDGDEDIINCNADWNTRESQEHVVWYENPGAESDTQKRPWKRHTIYEGSEFFSKPRIAVGDLDNDGRVDFCVPTSDAIFYFRKTSVSPVTWERIVIAKDETTKWLQRPLAMADVNADGKLDLVGMLIYDFKKKLPADKAAVYAMTYDGTRPTSDNWSTHVIKWGDGTPKTGEWHGEKWDHCRFVDVDGDGDIDIVGNCEEHHDEDHRAIIGVVWFENPRISSSGHR